MKRTLRVHVGVSLILVGLAHLSATTVANPAEPSCTIILRIYNYAEVGDEILIQAQEEVTRILGKAGVKTIWVDAALPSGKKHVNPVNQRSSLQLTISILSRAMVERRYHEKNAFGETPCNEGKRARLAYVFYQRVKDFVQEQGVFELKAKILGHAIAHEIGHMLLPFNYSHFADGIMRAHWDRHDLQRAAWGELLFAPEQAELIRTRVLRD